MSPLPGLPSCRSNGLGHQPLVRRSLATVSTQINSNKAMLTELARGQVLSPNVDSFDLLDSLDSLDSSITDNFFIRSFNFLVSSHRHPHVCISLALALSTVHNKQRNLHSETFVLLKIKQSTIHRHSYFINLYIPQLSLYIEKK